MSEVDPSGAAGAEVNPTRRTALSVGFGILAVPVIGAAGYQSIKAAAGGTDVRANLTLVAPAAAAVGERFLATPLPPQPHPQPAQPICKAANGRAAGGNGTVDIYLFGSLHYGGPEAGRRPP